MGIIDEVLSWFHNRLSKQVTSSPGERQGSTTMKNIAVEHKACSENVTAMAVAETDHQNDIQQPGNGKAVELRRPTALGMNNEYKRKEFQKFLAEDQLSRLKNPKSNYLRTRVALGDAVGASWREEE